MQFSDRSKTTILILVMAITLAGFLTASRGRSPFGMPSVRVISEDAAKKWETETDDQANVAVVVTPTDLSPQSAEWKFDVALGTHSVELDQDMVKIAVLIDDQGKEYGPIAWQGAEGGGHHREGTLVFKRIDPAPDTIKLRIRDIGPAVRMFKWQMRDKQ